jgi:hypothetical protein
VPFWGFSLKKLLALFLVLIAAYVAYPYVTLWRIGQAFKDKDAVTLDALVDWPRVRETVKSEVLALASDTALGPQDLSISGALGSALGAKLVDGIIDGYVSPRGLFRLSDKFDPEKAWQNIGYAFFVSPTQFRVDFRPPDKPSAVFSFLLSMSGLEWKVTNVVLPSDALLKGSESVLQSRLSRTTVAPSANVALTDNDIASLKKQFAKCWAPKNNVSVWVAISLNRDGSLSGEPYVLSPEKSAPFLAAADSALAAVRKCQPYSLPGASYEAWKKVEISFEPTRVR